MSARQTSLIRLLISAGDKFPVEISTYAFFCMFTPLNTGLNIVESYESAFVTLSFQVDRKKFDFVTAVRTDFNLKLRRTVVA